MIAVLDTGLANASSVLYAIERLGYQAVLTRDSDLLSKGSHVILPGVGSAGALMKQAGAAELKQCVRELKQPVLGICLGMQVLYDFSEEGSVECFGILPGTVTPIKPKGNLTIPHMGWNQVRATKNSLLLRGIPDDTYFYFVHSFHVPMGPETVAAVEYGESFSAVIESSQWFGTQFHPEKSGRNGEIVIRNFLNFT